MADPISAAAAAALIKGAVKIGGALLGRKRQRIPAAELRRQADVARRFENQERAKRGQPLLPWYPWQVQATPTPPAPVPSPPRPDTFPPDTPPDQDDPDEPIPGDPEPEPFPDDIRQPEAGYPDSAFEDLPPLPGESVAVAGIAGSAAAKDKLIGAARKYYGRILDRDRSSRGRARARPRGPRLPKLGGGPVGIATVGAVLIGQALELKKQVFSDLEKEQEKILKDADKAANQASKAIRKQQAAELAERRRQESRDATERYRNARLAQTDRAFRAARTDKALDQARARARRAQTRVNKASSALDREFAARSKAIARATRATTPRPGPSTRPGTFTNPQILAALAGALGNYLARERGRSSTSSTSSTVIQDRPPPRIGDPAPVFRSPGLTGSYSPGLGFAPGLSSAPQAARQAAEKCYTVCRKPGKRRKKKGNSKRICYDRKVTP